MENIKYQQQFFKYQTQSGFSFASVIADIRRAVNIQRIGGDTAMVKSYLYGVFFGSLLVSYIFITSITFPFILQNILFCLVIRMLLTDFTVVEGVPIYDCLDKVSTLLWNLIMKLSEILLPHSLLR